MDMDNDILSALFSSYVENSFKGIKALNGNDLENEQSALDEFSRKQGLSQKEQIFLENEIISNMTLISEYKGFTNGFKLAMRMAFEVNG